MTSFMSALQSFTPLHFYDPKLVLFYFVDLQGKIPHLLVVFILNLHYLLLIHEKRQVAEFCDMSYTLKQLIYRFSNVGHHNILKECVLNLILCIFIWD